jgi:hypothetical protein
VHAGVDLGDLLSASGGAVETVLVAGPTRESVGRVPERLLGAAVAEGDGAVAVTTERRADSAVDRLGRAGVPDERQGVVDCTDAGHGLRSDADGLRWGVPSPTEFTGTGIAVSECLDALADRGVGVVHLLYDSLSTPLVATDAETVWIHAHQLVTRGDRQGVAVFPVYTNLTGGRDRARLEHLCDAAVEVRRREGDRHVRVTGTDRGRGEWRPLPDPVE